jgi:hypothetical protein
LRLNSFVSLFSALLRLLVSALRTASWAARAGVGLRADRPAGPTRCRGRAGPLPVWGRDGPLSDPGPGVEKKVSGDVTELGGAGSLAHSVYTPQGSMAGQGRRGGYDGSAESGTEALRGASAPRRGRLYATLLGPSSRRCGFIFTWRLGDGAYASLPLWRHRPTKLGATSSSPLSGE